MTTPDARLRNRYIFYHSQLRRTGMNAKKVDEARARLTEPRDSIDWVHPKAHRPTGAALGVPVPDRGVTRKLWRITRLIGGFVLSLDTGVSPAFAYVPQDFYHVTLVNHTHHENKDIAVHPINADEYQHLVSVVQSLNIGPLTLHLQGLVLTTWGRLCVSTFPVGDDFYRLRAELAAQVPQLRTNLPVSGRMKLGIVTAKPAPHDEHRLFHWIDRCGEHVSARVTFTHLHTPVGDIRL